MRTFNNEQEQLEFLKDFWNNYGRVLVVGVLLGLLVMYAWQYFKSDRMQHRQQASNLYEQVLKSFNNNDNEVLASEVKILKKDFQNTPYAALATLVAARAYAEAGQYDDATNELSWVLSHSKDEADKQIARVRLARIYLQEEKYDQGLAALNANDFPAFDLYTLEVKGDLYLAKGERDKAREAYKAALALGQNPMVSNLIEMKLSNLAD